MIKNKVKNYIKEYKMLEETDSVVMGVSGGADSMCLLHMMTDICKDKNIKLNVVHIHHGIRKETADRDALFVEKYCADRGIMCIVKRYDVPSIADEKGMSEEEAGRKVRYEAFEAVGKLAKGRYKLAVAHNADDSAETVLLNLFRGSGIKGMGGILPVRDNIIRPVLCLTRQEIEKYNADNDVPYIHDETNFETEYTRNRIRLNILPEVKAYINKRASEHINMTGQALTDINDYMEKECDKLYNHVVAETENNEMLTVEIKVCEYEKMHKAMAVMLIKKCLYNVAGCMKDITARHMTGVCDLFASEVGKMVNLPYGMKAKRTYDSVIILHEEKNEEIAVRDAQIMINGEGRYSLETAEGKVVLSVEKSIYTKEIFEEYMYTKWIECDIMDDTLLFRTRRDGDYIVIDEKGSKKKLKDFFIDKKIPKEKRDSVCLLARGSEVLWIVGYRLGASCKVRHECGNIWKLHADYAQRD